MRVDVGIGVVYRVGFFGVCEFSGFCVDFRRFLFAGVVCAETSVLFVDGGEEFVADFAVLLEWVEAPDGDDDQAGGFLCESGGLQDFGVGEAGVAGAGEELSVFVVGGAEFFDEMVDFQGVDGGFSGVVEAVEQAVDGAELIFEASARDELNALRHDGFEELVGDIVFGVAGAALAVVVDGIVEGTDGTVGCVVGFARAGAMHQVEALICIPVEGEACGVIGFLEGVVDAVGEQGIVGDVVWVGAEQGGHDGEAEGHAAGGGFVVTGQDVGQVEGVGFLHGGFLNRRMEPFLCVAPIIKKLSPAIPTPCCRFWFFCQKLGSQELMESYCVALGGCHGRRVCGSLAVF